MIELIILNYLNEALDVPVFMEVPEDDIEAFVILEKTGSSKTNHIPTATIALQSYGPSLYEAALLNEQVKDAVERMVELDEVSAVRLNSDYNFTDSRTKRYRYQCLYVITYGIE